MADLFLTGSQGQSTDQPGPPSLPSIPNWDGTQGGLNDVLGALTEAVRKLGGQNPGTNNTQQGNPGHPGSPSQPKSNSGSKQKNSRWVEKSRATQTVKVTNPNDPTQYVMVKQITQLVMQDNVTKETWTWNL